MLKKYKFKAKTENLLQILNRISNCESIAFYKNKNKSINNVVIENNHNSDINRWKYSQMVENGILLRINWSQKANKLIKNKPCITVSKDSWNVWYY